MSAGVREADREPLSTVVRARWIVGFDGREHRLLEDGELLFAGDTIRYLGPRRAMTADRLIDAGNALVIPGLISTHAHASSHAGDRLIVDAGRRDLLRSGFLNYEPPSLAGGPRFGAEEDEDAAIRFALSCLLESGVTTVVEMGRRTRDGGATLVRLAGECGIRLYYAPYHTGADYACDADGRLHRLWDEARGFAELDRAAAFIELHRGAHGGRIDGILVLNEAYNATPALLRRTKETAARLGVGITLHVAEQLYEFHDALRTRGLTPVGVLAAEGLLGPEVILGHCRFVGGHSETGYPYPGDLELVAEAGSTVAHAPLAGARRGSVLESFQRYLECGVNLALGTDTYPLDILAEMRCAALVGKVVDADPEASRAIDVFNAATLGGARALGRDDLGRLAPGAKADLVIVDLGRLRVGPVRDPIRALVHCVTSELVRTVIVAGEIAVGDGAVVAWDDAETLAAVRGSTARVWDGFAACHWSGRTIEQVFGASLDAWTSSPESGSSPE